MSGHPTPPQGPQQPQPHEGVEIQAEEQLLTQLEGLVPGEYDPDNYQETRLYIDGQRRETVQVINASGRYNVLHRKGHLKEPDILWVMKGSGEILRMHGSDSGALEPETVDYAAELSELLARGSAEKPRSRARRLIGRTAVNH
jgi:hypothetical protein